jgi:hypothetical protein
MPTKSHCSPPAGVTDNRKEILLEFTGLQEFGFQRRLSEKKGAIIDNQNATPIAAVLMEEWTRQPEAAWFFRKNPTHFRSAEPQTLIFPKPNPLVLIF